MTLLSVGTKIPRAASTFKSLEGKPPTEWDVKISLLNFHIDVVCMLRATISEVIVGCGSMIFNPVNVCSLSLSLSLSLSVSLPFSLPLMSLMLSSLSPSPSLLCL